MTHLVDFQNDCERGEYCFAPPLGKSDRKVIVRLQWICIDDRETTAELATLAVWAESAARREAAVIAIMVHKL